MAENIFLNYRSKNPSEITLEAIKKYRLMYGKSCIFLSHQKGDAQMAKKIADYLIDNNKDVYFDEYDEDARIANQTKNPKAVTAAILKGINLSSHMLCIVSANTVKSSWVPFEIGYGYDKTKMGVLVLEDVDVNTIPEYLRSVDIFIRDIYDLNELLLKLNPLSEMEKKQFNYANTNHPLLSIMKNIIQY